MRAPSELPCLMAFLSFSSAAFSFFSHFLADRCICFDTIRRLIISSSNDTLLPIFIIVKSSVSKYYFVSINFDYYFCWCVCVCVSCATTRDDVCCDEIHNGSPFLFRVGCLISESCPRTKFGIEFQS